MNKTVKIRAKCDSVPMPEYAHPGDAAMDLRAADDCYIEPQEWHTIPTGLRMEIPEGYVGFVMPRSGLSTKQGLTLINAVGVIDSGYRGEIGAPIYNANRTVGRRIRKGDRIAQIAIVPVVHAELVEADELSDSDRGSGGFGSTGVE